MAKGLRASSRKRNKSNLRAKIFGPAHDARTERLSAKLQEVATKRRPDDEKAMDLDVEEDAEKQKDVQRAESNSTEDMDIDAQGAKMKAVKRAPAKRSRPGRVEKKSTRKKPRNSMRFPPNARQKKRLEGKKRKS